MATELDSLPPTMRVWNRPSRGFYRTNLKLTTIPTPSLQVGSEILIKVSYVPLSFSTIFMLGILPAFLSAQASIPELECSGTVVAAGPDAPSNLREPGTLVAAFQSPLNVVRGRGFLAEYVKIDAKTVMAIPEGLRGRMKEVGGLTCAGQTALRMVKTAGVKIGDVVLVNGASGGVGTILVQLLKLAEARVIGVASGGNEELVSNLGADDFVDYRKHKNLPKYLTEKFGTIKLDYILDCVGTQALYTHSPAYLKPEGLVINVGVFEGLFTQLYNSVVNMAWPRRFGGIPRRYIMFSTPPMLEPGLELIKLMNEGKIRVPIEDEWRFEDVIEAYDRIGSKRARGKIVITVQEDT